MTGTVHRYNWTDVQHVADLFFRSLADAVPTVIPATATGLAISPGSSRNGQSGCLSWRRPAPSTVLLPAPPIIRIPGGDSLPRTARDAYDNLQLRIRLLDDLFPNPTT